MLNVITTVHLLTSWNFLWEHQTIIPISTTCSSTTRLVRIKYPMCQNLEGDAKWIKNLSKKSLKNETKKLLTIF